MNHKYSLKVSIIVVSYNSKKELAKTLRSIKSQNYKNYEVIIADKKSYDGTRTFLKINKNLYSKLIQKKDKGIYEGMNNGIKIARGDWILFLNSGDIFYSKTILTKISRKLIRKYDIIYGDTVINNNNLKYISKSKYFKKINFELPFCHQSVFVKNKIMKKYKFNLKYKLSADFDLFLKLFLKKFSFHRIDNIISEITSGGLSDKNRVKVFKEYQKINLKYSKNIVFFYFNFLILFYFLKRLIKKIIGKNLTEKILKIKYNNMRIS